jgi:kumamolisin
VTVELTGRSRIRVAAFAACCALPGVTAAPIAASSAAHARTTPLVALPGTGVPATHGANAVGAVAPPTPVQAVVMFRPRNAALLRRLALAWSGRPGMSEARIRALFAPAPESVRAVESYLRDRGLTVTDRTDMTMTVRGTAAAAEHAFAAPLRVFRQKGRTFSAPAGPVHLPSALARAVATVGGLDTSVTLHPATTQAKLHSAAVISPNCSGARTAQRRLGGYLPADLGSTAGYGHNSLVSGGADGTGELIGAVEFSGYSRSDVNHFRSCFPGITGTYMPDAIVGRRNFDQSGKSEVALDLEVAMAAAPDADVRAYVSPNDPDFAPAILNRMRLDGVDVISDSWGACEPLIPPQLLIAESTALELAAVAGISTYVATGDFGSSDCLPFTGSTDPLIDDPSSQPFATAVGGTALEIPPVFSGHRETAWRGGGGGISMFWRKPAYQLGKTVGVRGHKCRGGKAQCRETPDVSLDARPRRTGYIIYCNHCGSGTGVPWGPIGGTSAGAPLMAALTADADESAGKQLGFANPFLYAHARSSMFHDIVSGTNNLFGGHRYTAHPGYDLATGLGSVRAGALASALAAWTPPPISRDSTRLRVIGPADGHRLLYGHRVTFRGRLIDTTTGTPIPNAQVLVVTAVDTYRVRTNAGGAWFVTRSRAIGRSTSWHAAYLGSEANAPVTSRPRKLLVQPHLGLRLHLAFRNGHYLATPGTPFAALGRAQPLMPGAIVTLQSRRSGGRWRNVGRTPVVGGGRYEYDGLRLRRGVTVRLRWDYPGGRFRRWLPAVSRTVTVVAR